MEGNVAEIELFQQKFVSLVDAPMKNSKKIFDGLLVMRYQTGDSRALAILVKRYQSDFCRYACWYTHDIEMARDVVQDSWSIIIAKLGTLKNPDSFRSWAMRIVTRKAQDQLRSSGRIRSLKKQHYPIIEDGGAEEELRAEQIKRLHVAIKELNFDQQLVLRLFYTQEYSLKEISTILEISVGTVKSRLYHAREKLKSNLNL
jgi:RNA polymerase sigma-70 factor (ECF subfamily)